MKNEKKRLKVIAALISVAAVFTVVLAEPGSTDDPLVSQSYIETVLVPQLKQYVENKISEVNTGSGTTDASQSVFKVVEVKTGQSLICSAGTELILRMGKAEIIATEKGGLADTTDGYDLSNKSAMPANHLLIVPLGDGRGIKALNDVLVMVKGGYELK